MSPGFKLLLSSSVTIAVALWVEAGGQSLTAPLSIHLNENLIASGWTIKTITDPEQLKAKGFFKVRPVQGIMLANEKVKQEKLTKSGPQWFHPSLVIEVYPEKDIQQLLKERASRYAERAKEWEWGQRNMPHRAVGPPSLEPVLFWITKNYVLFSSDPDCFFSDENKRKSKEKELRELVKEQLIGK